jgi:hypothetical protein
MCYYDLADLEEGPSIMVSVYVILTSVNLSTLKGIFILALVFILKLFCSQDSPCFTNEDPELSAGLCYFPKSHSWEVKNNELTKYIGLQRMFLQVTLCPEYTQATGLNREKWEAFG